MDGSNNYLGTSICAKALAVGDAILGKVSHEAAS